MPAPAFTIGYAAALEQFAPIEKIAALFARFDEGGREAAL